MLSLIRRRLLESERLPAVYQEVEYIKNNSTSGGLDLGFSMYANYNVEVTYKEDEITNQMVIGTSDSSSNNVWGYYLIKDQNGLKQRIYGGICRSVSVTQTRDLNKHTFHYYGGDSNYTTFIDSESPISASVLKPNVPTDYNLFFGKYSNTVPFKGRIYSCKIWDSNNISLINLIPCVRKSDDTPGFYDLVSKEFKTITDAKTKWEAGPIPGQELPYGVTGVEWLESTGTQYIDTGVMPTADTRFVVDGTFPNNEGTHGCFQTGSASCRFHLGNGGTKFHFGIGERYLWPTTPLIDVNRHVLEISGDGKAKIDSNTYTVSAGITNPSVKNIFLYANNANTITQYVIGKVYSSQIYESGVLIRDFVPVVKDNVGYMYDKVQQKLYTNAGTGSFVAGPEV